MHLRRVHAAAVVVLAVHVAFGVAALVLLPHGFALRELHAWTNTIVPLLAVAGTSAVLFLLPFSSRAAEATSFLLAMATGSWCAAIPTGALLFPKSLPLTRLVPLALVAMLLVALLRTAPPRRTVLALMLGAMLGIPLVFAQRSPPPSTRPLGGTLDEPTGTDQTLLVACGTQTLRVAPALRFESRSPDRTWTLLAPTHERDREDRSTVVTQQEEGGMVSIEAVTSLPSPVFSHLNSFTTLAFSFDATVSFSPTAPLRTAIEPADYPSGKPMQLAYVDASGVFHVARASDAEKGPYSELARGSLSRGEPLTIEIRPTASDQRGCRVTFADWSAQVSTVSSPTAGYGLPVNSVQFFSTERGSLILLTLADTGPGRGFDSVGHTAGVYRNRIRVSPLPP